MSKEFITEDDLIPTEDEELEVDEVEETELEDEEIEDELEEIYEDEELEDDDEEEPEELSKSDRAVIKYKKENKALRKQLEAIQRDDVDRELSIVEEKRVAELIESGKSEDLARKLASKEKDDSKLLYELNANKIKGLEGRYPGISLYTKELINLKNKYPDFSYEEIYSVKFNKSSPYEDKTRIEALARTNKAEVESRTLESATPKKRKRKTIIRLELEGAYKIWSKTHPGRSREEFYRLQD